MARLLHTLDIITKVFPKHDTIITEMPKSLYGTTKSTIPQIRELIIATTGWEIIAADAAGERKKI
jgi:hypothetical protein